MKKCLATLIVLAASMTCYAEPIDNLNEFQGKIEKCLKGGEPESCLNKLLSAHIPPGNENMEKSLSQVSSVFVKWLNGDKVYAVHPIKATKVGGLLERRIYAIEAQHGGFMVLDSSYLRIKGDLYLYSFNLSSTSEKIDAMFEDRL